MTTGGQKRPANLLRFQDAADALLSHGTLVDDDPFGHGIRPSRRMHVPRKVFFGSGLFGIAKGRNRKSCYV